MSFDLQDVFDRSVAGLASQGFTQSLKEHCGCRCRYNGPDGKHCAIGWLLPEGTEEPPTLGEALDVVGIEWRRRDLGTWQEDYSRETTYSLMAQLQAAHDSGGTPEDMMRHLRRFAHEHNLTLPPSLTQETP